MYTKSGRQENLDLARMLAILSVILIHTVEDVEYMQVLNGTLNIPIFRCVLEIIMFIAGRSGVFIFCMLTGALMGNRNIDNIKEHYINRVAPMIITTISWTIIYRLFYFFHNNMNYDLLNIKEGILEIALLNIKISNHLWFMPMIIGIYITMPFINILMKNLDDRQIILFITLNTIFCIALPTLELNLKGLGVINTTLETLIDYRFLGSQYLNCYTIGYLIMNRNFLKNISLKRIVYIDIIIIFLAITNQIFLFLKGENMQIINILQTNSLYIYIISILNFLLLTRNKIKISFKLEKVIYSISKLSFGIYLSHRLFMVLIVDNLNKFFMGALVKICIVFITTVIFSYVTSFIISKNKYTSKILMNFTK